MDAIAAISNKDIMFNTWLNQMFLPEDVSGMPSQLKCRKMFGEQVLDQGEQFICHPQPVNFKLPG
ncbi:MAG: hypothetical protein U0Z17_09865 [Bacteroidales bacterium]